MTVNTDDFTIDLTIDDLLNYRNSLNGEPSRNTLDDIVDNCFSSKALSDKFSITEDPKKNYYYVDSQTGRLVSPKQAQKVVSARLKHEVERLKGYRQQLTATPTVDESAKILEKLSYHGYDEAMNCYPSYAAHDIWTWREMYDELQDLSIDDEDCGDYPTKKKDEEQARYVKNSKYEYFSFDDGGKPVNAKETVDFIDTQIEQAVHPEEVLQDPEN